ncbi:MAG: hypothetical protein ACLP2P_10510 [Desulfobaccales bacterium]
MKTLGKSLVILALATVICLPGVASADYTYTQTWYENGLYGTPATLQTFNMVEAILVTPGATWVGTGLTGLSSAPDWTATLVTPQIAEASAPAPGALYDVSQSGDFWFTTTATSPTDTGVTFEWLLFNGTTFVGGELITISTGGVWSASELTHAPLPPTVLLLGTGLLGLIGLRRKSRRDKKDDSI